MISNTHWRKLHQNKQKSLIVLNKELALVIFRKMWFINQMYKESYHEIAYIYF